MISFFNIKEKNYYNKLLQNEKNQSTNPEIIEKIKKNNEVISNFVKKGRVNSLTFNSDGSFRVIAKKGYQDWDQIYWVVNPYLHFVKKYLKTHAVNTEEAKILIPSIESLHVVNSWEVGKIRNHILKNMETPIVESSSPLNDFLESALQEFNQKIDGTIEFHQQIIQNEKDKLKSLRKKLIIPAVLTSVGFGAGITASIVMAVFFPISLLALPVVFLGVVIPIAIFGGRYEDAKKKSKEICAEHLAPLQGLNQRKISLTDAEKEEFKELIADIDPERIKKDFEPYYHFYKAETRVKQENIRIKEIESLIVRQKAKIETMRASLENLEDIQKELDLLKNFNKQLENSVQAIRNYEKQRLRCRMELEELNI